MKMRNKIKTYLKRNKILTNIKDFIRGFDYILFFSAILLVIYGLILINSAIGLKEFSFNFDFSSFFYRQILWSILGLIIFFILLFFNYAWLKKFWWLVYIINLIGLIAVFIIGHISHGARSWIGWGMLKIQPSEFFKIGIIITLAGFLSRKKEEDVNFFHLFITIFLAGLPIILIILQPDIGTAVIYIGIVIGILYLAGLRKIYLFTLFILGLLSILIIIKSGYVEQYVLNRLLVFLNPNLDPYGIGYTLNQSIIAIGSGGLFGKGLFKGIQTALRFVPEPHTDFIFCILGEELGFVGAVILISLYALIIFRIIRVGITSKDKFGALICGGIATFLLLQFFINIGVTIGIMPITGLTLPLISYGGSSLITAFFGLGLVESIYLRRFYTP